MAVQAAIPVTETFAPPAWGSSHPIGAVLTADGANVSVYAKRASAVDVLLFDGVDDGAPLVIELDRATNRTGPYWHTFLPGVGAGQVYGLRAHGPYAPERGLRFAPDRVLLDPYGRGVAVPAGYTRAPGGSPTSDPAGDLATAMKSVVVDLGDYDWEGDVPLGRSFADTVIYEAHVKGFTAHPNSGVDAERRGTFAGFIDRIPYLVSLGVTAVELLPVFAFDALDAPGDRPNYWGYQPVSFFAPHAAYSSRPGAQGAVDELRDLVKALHKAGLEVILDVVYNHTAEGGPDGPTFCYRGLANEEYYIAGQCRPLPLRRLQRHRQHAQRQRAGRPAAHPRQPPLLGRGDARRRVPLRSRVGAVARRGRPTGPAAARHLGHRDRSDPGRHEADRRSVGRGRPVPGRFVRGRSLGRVERPLPRRRAVIRQGRSRQGLGDRGNASWRAPTSTPGSTASPSRRSTSSPATTGSRSTTSSRTTRSTTRRTARATATATTRT